MSATASIVARSSTNDEPPGLAVEVRRRPAGRLHQPPLVLDRDRVRAERAVGGLPCVNGLVQIHARPVSHRPVARRRPANWPRPAMAATAPWRALPPRVRDSTTNAPTVTRFQGTVASRRATATPAAATHAVVATAKRAWWTHRTPLVSITPNCAPAPVATAAVSATRDTAAMGSAIDETGIVTRRYPAPSGVNPGGPVPTSIGTACRAEFRRIGT